MAKISGFEFVGRPENWSDPDFLSMVSEEFQNLEEFVLTDTELDLQAVFGANQIEAGLTMLEEDTSWALGRIIPEVPEGYCVAEARAWAQTRQALEHWLTLNRGKEPETLDALCISSAVAALAHAQQCRNELERGSPSTALLAMFRAMHLWSQMDLILHAPTLEEAFDSRNRRKRGQEESLNSKRRKHQPWLGEYRKLSIQHPKWSRTRIAEEIGKTNKPQRHKTTVLRALKRLEENEGSDS